MLHVNSRSNHPLSSMKTTDDLKIYLLIGSNIMTQAFPIYLMYSLHLEYHKEPHPEAITILHNMFLSSCCLNLIISIHVSLFRNRNSCTSLFQQCLHLDSTQIKFMFFGQHLNHNLGTPLFSEKINQARCQLSPKKISHTH